MILRDVDDIKVGSTSVNKVYQGNYKVYDKNKIALEGYCKQNTTTGKNLLEIALPTQTTARNGITFTNNGDGTFTLNGTATANADFRVEQSTPSGSNNFKDYDGTYTIYCPDLPSGVYFGSLTYNDGTYGPFTNSLNDTTPIFTNIVNVTNGFFYVVVLSGTQVNNLTLRPMFVKGSYTISTIGDFEPYTGGIPSPNPNYPQEIEVMEGKQVVNVSSDNKFKMPLTIIAGAGTGITPTYNDDGSITLNGTSTGGVVEFRSIVQLSETHTLSYTSNKTSSNVYIRTRAYSSDETSFPSIQDSITLDRTSNSIVSNKTFGFVCITIANNTTLDNFTIYPQLVTGSTEKPYVPYKSQDFEVDLKSKNLLRQDQYLATRTINGITFTNNGDDTFNITGTATANTSINFLNGTSQIGLRSGKTYYLYSSQPYNVITFNLSIPFLQDGVQKYLTANSSITTSGEISDMKLAFYISSGKTVNVQNVKLMLVEGSTATATDYEPYYNYKLAGIGDYKDNIYTKEGKWYVKSLIGKVVLDGSENWGKSGASTSSIFVGTTNITNAIDGNGLSNLFIYSSQVGVGYFTIYNNGANLRLCVDNNTISTIEAFKSWLSTHNTEVYYVLATPTEEEITSPTLIQQLNRLYQAM